MSLGEIRHGLDQAAREVRRRGLEQTSDDGPRCDPAFATLEELDAMEAAILAEDSSALARLAADVNERAATGEHPEDVLPMTANVAVRFAPGVLAALKEPEVTRSCHPETVASDLEEPEESPEIADVITTVSTPAHKRSEHDMEPQGSNPPEPDNTIARHYTWRSQRSRPPEGTAGEIAEREF